MGKRIPVGVESYKEIVDENYYYVDKTLLIKEILDGGAKASLFTRPRRFGKTLALSMLKTFFEDERDGKGNKIDNSHYFAGKKISGCGEDYLLQQGRYPVVSLTLKSAKQPDFDLAYDNLKRVVAEEFARHSYLLKSGVLRPDEIQRYQEIMEGRAKAADDTTAIAFLSNCLKKYHGNGVIVLVDEYDVPLENAYFKGFYGRMIDFIRSLLESALKTNDSLKFAVITGCLRVSKESVFTGLNNLKVVSILSRNYSEYFGFTSDEVYAMLEGYGLENRMEEAKEWYDGYLFGETEIYNPWSIINCVNDNQGRTEFRLESYWANTSSNDIVRELVEDADLNTREEIECLLAGGMVRKPVYEDITYGDLRRPGNSIWSFLLFTGYLRKAREWMEGRKRYLGMIIPNQEVAGIYEDTVLLWFDQRIKAMGKTRFYHALVAGDCSVVEASLKEQLIKSISFYDTAEQFYHGFMVGVLGGLEEYRLWSNRETGDGRADILMLPGDDRNPVLIFEFKKVDKFVQMEDGCKAALAQIKEKCYDAECREEGYTKFIKYGICFCKKSCMVRAEIVID